MNISRRLALKFAACVPFVRATKADTVDPTFVFNQTNSENMWVRVDAMAQVVKFIDPFDKKPKRMTRQQAINTWKRYHDIANQKQGIATR